MHCDGSITIMLPLSSTISHYLAG